MTSCSVFGIMIQCSSRVRVIKRMNMIVWGIGTMKCQMPRRDGREFTAGQLEALVSALQRAPAHWDPPRTEAGL